MTLGLVFSPQGSQAVGMGRQLAEGSAAARAVFAEADATLGWSVSATCWEGPAERLSETLQTQPCLLTTSIAALRALEERAALQPSVVAGHSVGEYAALVAAGVLDLGAGLRLVARRAELMTAAAADADGGMLAVIGLERDAVQRVVDAVGRPTELVVANDNAPGQVVVSGRTDALLLAADAMRAVGARRLITLPVSGAFHSPLMAGVADELADAFDSETWTDARIPVVSNVTAEPVTDAGRLRALLAEQVRSPVEWVRSVRRMRDDGVGTIVELGSGAALVGMIRRIAPDVRGAAVNDLATLEDAVAVVGSPAGASVS
jgi:[acyl-carrier-protein] S-malonyltransferase